MLTKNLKRMEVNHGFVYIPIKKKVEFFGNVDTPLHTKLNELPARVDKQGRLWSNYIKNLFEVNTEVTLTKNDNGFQIIASGHKTLLKEGRQSMDVFSRDSVKQEQTTDVLDEFNGKTKIVLKVCSLFAGCGG